MTIVFKHNGNRVGKPGLYVNGKHSYYPISNRWIFADGTFDERGRWDDNSTFDETEKQL